MADLDAETILEAGQRWLEVVEEAERHELRLRLEDLQDPDTLRKAWDFLHADVPLPSREGYEGPPYTPKQVLTLTESWEPITHNQEVYQRTLAGVRRELGRRHPIRCTANAGERACRNYALPYIARVRCWNHADADEREQNQTMKEEEERLLRERLSLVVAAFHPEESR